MLFRSLPDCDWHRRLSDCFLWRSTSHCRQGGTPGAAPLLHIDFVLGDQAFVAAECNDVRKYAGRLGAQDIIRIGAAIVVNVFRFFLRAIEVAEYLQPLGRAIPVQALQRGNCSYFQ